MERTLDQHVRHVCGQSPSNIATVVPRSAPGVSRRSRRRHLLVYAAYDLTFPVDLSLVLIDEFRRRGLPHETALLRCGHYSTGTAPFKYVDGYVLTKFLRSRL